jgi:RNA polymerase sigma-70 factor (ECF subfamily)
MKQEDILTAAIRAQDALTAYAFVITRDWALAQDAFQEGLIVVARKWESLDPSGDVLGWIRGVIRREALSLLRSRGQMTYVGDEDMLDLLDQQFAPEMEEDRIAQVRQWEEALRACLQKLGGRARHLILGFYGRENSGRSLAAEMDMSEEAVRVNLHRIRNKLRACVERYQQHEARE